MEINYWSDYACPYCYIGVPYFVINGEYAIPGALSREQMVSVLRKILQQD